MSRSARSRPRPSPSTARRTSSTTTFPPSPTTTSRSPSCGSQESLSATRLLTSSLPPPLLPQRSRSTRLFSSSTSRRWRMPPTCPSPTRTMPTS
ncbi:hypothetical protein E4T44_15312, partial [Aureobasidium sp. EXF-8845]